MPRLLAPSISRTSSERLEAISAQEEQLLQGRGVGPFSQLSALARRRATVVLPTPLKPEKRYAWWMRFCATAFWRVVTIGAWPTTSSNVWGRYLRART